MAQFKFKSAIGFKDHTQSSNTSQYTNKANYIFHNDHISDEEDKDNTTNRNIIIIFIIIGLCFGFLSFQLILFLIVIYIKNEIK